MAAPDGSATVEVPSRGPGDAVRRGPRRDADAARGLGRGLAGGETVALDLAVTGALRFEGYAREAVRLIQEARKASGLDVSDRIVVRWTARTST